MSPLRPWLLGSRMLGSQGLGRYRFISLGRWPLLSMVDLHVSGHKRTRIWLCSTTTTTKPGSARDLNLKLLTATFVGQCPTLKLFVVLYSV
uniref:Uncharacterized protein n=1 Tax=Aegilops tauschii subsp. strangulata TaxID=200361 RepID=A0A452Z0Y0_AEGTS